MVGAIPFLSEAAYWEFARLLTVESLWTFCLLLPGWLVATVVGGPIGLAVNVLTNSPRCCAPSVSANRLIGFFHFPNAFRSHSKSSISRRK